MSTLSSDRGGTPEEDVGMTAAMPSAMADIEDIAPEGEVVIATSAIRLRVSATVLGFVSKPMKAMLTSTFEEGLRFRHASVRAPAYLRLPDDDGSAIRVLMHLAHFTGFIRTFTPSYDLFGEIVTLADKYLCVHVITGQCDSWLSNYPAQDMNLCDLECLTKASYTLDNNTQFERMTRILAKCFADRDLADKLQSGLLKAMVRNLRLNLLTEMQQSIEQCISDLRWDDPHSIFQHYNQICSKCNAEITPAHHHPPNDPCPYCGRYGIEQVLCNANLRVKDITVFLEGQLGIWPVSAIMTTSKPVDIATKELVEEFGKWELHQCAGGKGCPIYEALYKLQTALENIFDNVSGIHLMDFKREARNALWW